MTKRAKVRVTVTYGPGCEPKPMTRWESLVDDNTVCHLLWSYKFTARRCWRATLLDLRCMGILR